MARISLLLGPRGTGPNLDHPPLAPPPPAPGPRRFHCLSRPYPPPTRSLPPLRLQPHRQHLRPLSRMVDDCLLGHTNANVMNSIRSAVHGKVHGYATTPKVGMHFSLESDRTVFCRPYSLAT